MYIILGLILGIGITCFFLIPKVKHQEQINHDIINQNIETEIEYNKKFLELKHAREELTTLKSQTQELESALDREKKLIQSNIEKEKEIALNKLSEEYSKAEEEYNKEYSNVLQDCVDSFQREIKEKNIEIKNINDELNSLRATRLAALEASRREVLIQASPQDYSIQISNSDKYDIEHILEFATTLNNSRPLLMLVWSTFIKTPFDNLCNKVVGTGRICGIYKITYKNEIYIGQSVDVSSRLHTHAKKILGIDMPQTNKLYNYLNKVPFWDITWELLEECPQERLNEKEKFYIDLYQSTNSLNTTSGGS